MPPRHGRLMVPSGSTDGDRSGRWRHPKPGCLVVVARPPMRSKARSSRASPLVYLIEIFKTERSLVSWSSDNQMVELPPFATFPRTLYRPSRTSPTRTAYQAEQSNPVSDSSPMRPFSSTWKPPECANASSISAKVAESSTGMVSSLRPCEEWW